MGTRFSERVGAAPRCEALLLEDISPELRIAIWNILGPSLVPRAGFSPWLELAQLAAVRIINFPADEVPSSKPKGWFKALIFDREWHVVYDLLEFAVEQFPRHQRNCRHSREVFVQKANAALQRHGSGYRFMRGQLGPITNPAEIEAIESAATSAAFRGLEGARAHLDAAVELLSKKPEPDYRNSIKESISAVESVAKKLSDETGSGLAPALRALGRQTEIHGALESGFNKLYGFSSDEDGIRHAILDQANVGFDEAKFMLVACSAFVNFLISKADAAGLLSDS